MRSFLFKKDIALHSPWHILCVFMTYTAPHHKLHGSSHFTPVWIYAVLTPIHMDYIKNMMSLQVIFSLQFVRSKNVRLLASYSEVPDVEVTTSDYKFYMIQFSNLFRPSPHDHMIVDILNIMYINPYCNTVLTQQGKIAIINDYNKKLSAYLGSTTS